MKYGYTKEVPLTFEEAIVKVKEALGANGFGVLTEIDVKATMQKKLGIEYENYTILGACNPQFAHKALEEEKEIGLLLPCNVIVYENEGKVRVSAILPSIAMGMVENEKLPAIATEVETLLKKAIDQI